VQRRHLSYSSQEEVWKIYQALRKGDLRGEKVVFMSCFAQKPCGFAVLYTDGEGGSKKKQPQTLMVNWMAK